MITQSSYGIVHPVERHYSNNVAHLISSLKICLTMNH
ncbi:hypothetical protein [Vibrio phage vB_VpaP_M9]|nr:hypothetical protein [Vibrio phage vB_VpaP_M83]USL89855.1 hypothetical protein [Vibrio phage vB_VpaP_M9]